MMTGINKRKNGIELLRIIAMLMIVVLHMLGHGEVLTTVQPDQNKYYFCWTLEGMCYIAVNCFVLITGYFSSRSKARIEKILFLWLQVFVFSAVIYLCFALTGAAEFDGFSLFKALTPTVSGMYWFATVYIGLNIIVPFINGFLNNLTDKQHWNLILIMVILFSLIPTLFPYSTWVNFGGGYGLVWFIVLYMTGAYIRKMEFRRVRNVYWILGYLGCISLLPITKFVINYLVTQMHLENMIVYTDMMYMYNSIAVLCGAVCIFMLFLNLDFKSSWAKKAIAFFAPLTFGVYLIHDNKYIRSWLWGKLTPQLWIRDKILIFLIKIVIVPLLVYVICSLITWLMMCLLKKIRTMNLYQDIVKLLERKIIYKGE